MIAKVKISLIPLLGTACLFFGLTTYVKMFNFLQVQTLDLCRFLLLYSIFLFSLGK